MKMNNLKLLLPFIFMALAVMACAQDCMGTIFSVQGYIVDSNGNPFEGAGQGFNDELPSEITVTLTQEN
jgi:hypothetical protein